jgi:hypothetical protein
MSLTTPSQQSLVPSPIAGVDPVVSPADPLMGEWWADKSAERLVRKAPAAAARRYGASAPPPGAFGRWIFIPEGQGVRLKQFGGDDAGFSQAATVDFFATWDGRPWADPNGPAFLGQLVQFWRLDPHLTIRLVLDNVVPARRLEWTAYAVSADGGTMTATSWDDAAPAAQDFQLFARQGARTADDAAPAASDVGSWEIDPRLHVRRDQTDGRSTWSIHAADADGATTITRWDEATPHVQSVSSAGAS